VVEHINSGRKDTGRTDKYSDESPKKDYQDYRSDYPKSEETARKISKDITDGNLKPQHIGSKSFLIRKQELISHIQNFKETFSNAEKKIWLVKRDELLRNLENKG
jgi:hypothetical protein